MVNDTISDMLTRIRNANNAKHYLVQIPLTKMTKNIAGILNETQNVLGMMPHPERAAELVHGCED